MLQRDRHIVCRDPMLSLSDSQRAVVYAGARRLSPSLHDWFLRQVALRAGPHPHDDAAVRHIVDIVLSTVGIPTPA
jgi:hypothetical protein